MSCVMKDIDHASLPDICGHLQWYLTYFMAQLQILTMHTITCLIWSNHLRIIGRNGYTRHERRGVGVVWTDCRLAMVASPSRLDVHSNTSLGTMNEAKSMPSLSYLLQCESCGISFDGSWLLLLMPLRNGFEVDVHSMMRSRWSIEMQYAEYLLFEWRALIKAHQAWEEIVRELMVFVDERDGWICCCCIVNARSYKQVSPKDTSQNHVHVRRNMYSSTHTRAYHFKSAMLSSTTNTTWCYQRETNSVLPISFASMKQILPTYKSCVNLQWLSKAKQTALPQESSRCNQR